jgi:hypothetical protein
MSRVTRIRAAASGVLFFTALLAACGGGGGAAPAPVPMPPMIIAFDADRADYAVGETARLSARFSGGAGRIEPGLGSVADGVSVVTPVLDGDRTFRLVVEGPQGRVERELRLAVRHRDRYTGVGAFRSVGHEAVALADGSVLLIGGSRQEGVLSHRVTRFDPRLRLFSDIGMLQVGRVDHRATLLASGDVLVTGGETSLPQPRLIEWIDARTGQSAAAGELAVKRAAHTATRLQDGRVLIAGGYSGSAVSDSAELWDPRTRESVPLGARMVTPRAAHSATLLADGRVLLVGGFAPATPRYIGAELFDPKTGTFSAVSGSGGVVRLLHAAQRQSDGSVLIVGGESYEAATDTTTALRDIVRFDPQRERFEVAGQLSMARSAVRMDGDAAQALLFGGLGASDSYLATAEALTPVGSARSLAALPGGRAWHTVTRLADGRYLIAGGMDESRNLVPQALVYE